MPSATPNLQNQPRWSTIVTQISINHAANIIKYFQPNNTSRRQIDKLTLEVIFQTDLRCKKEHQQLVNVFFVGRQEQSTRLRGQLANQFFAFHLRLPLHPVVLRQADGT